MRGRKGEREGGREGEVKRGRDGKGGGEEGNHYESWTTFQAP